MKRALRRANRRFRAIIRRGTVEPVLVLFLGNLLLSGGTLMLAKETPVLPWPALFGSLYLLLAGVGLVGLAGRRDWLKSAFGFIGFFLRVWMAIFYFRTNWQDPTWCGFALAAFGYGWIATRCACRHVWQEARAAHRRS